MEKLTIAEAECEPRGAGRTSMLPPPASSEDENNEKLKSFKYNKGKTIHSSYPTTLHKLP